MNKRHTHTHFNQLLLSFCLRFTGLTFPPCRISPDHSNSEVHACSSAYPTGCLWRLGQRTGMFMGKPSLCGQ